MVGKVKCALRVPEERSEKASDERKYWSYHRITGTNRS